MFNPFQAILSENSQQLQLQIDQGIEADIERLLQDDEKENDKIERELVRLSVIREEKKKKIKGQEVMLFANNTVQVAECTSQQLVITITDKTSTDNNTSHLYTRILQLQHQNTLLQLQIQSFTRQQRFSNLNHQTNVQPNLSNYKYERKIKELEKRIVGLEKEMMELEIENRVMKGRLNEKESEKQVPLTRLIELPLELMLLPPLQHPQPQIIQKQVLFQVPVPIYIKTYKSAIFPKSNTIRLNNHNNSRYYQQYQSKYNQHQLIINERNYNDDQESQRNGNNNISEEQYVEEERGVMMREQQQQMQHQDTTSLELKSQSDSHNYHQRSSTIRRQPKINNTIGYMTTTTNNHNNNYQYQQLQIKQSKLTNKLSRQMRIDNMCKSIESQQIDQQQFLLEEWQGRRIRKHMSTNQQNNSNNKLAENNDSTSQKGNKLNLTSMKIRQVQSGIMLSANNSNNKLQQQQQQKEIIQVPVYIIKQIPVPQYIMEVKEVIVEKQIVRYIEVPVENVVEIEKIVQVRVEIEKLIEVPIQVQTIKYIPIQVVRLVQLPVQIETTKQVIVQVEKIIEVQKLIEIPIQIQTLLQVPIEIIESPKLIQIPIEVQLQTQKQQQTIIQLIEMPVKVQVEKIVEVQRLVQIPIVIEIVKLIEIPVQVQSAVTKLIELPVEVVNKIEVKQQIRVVKQVPVVHLVQLPVQIIDQVILQTIQEVPYQIIKQVPYQIIKQVPVEIIKQVTNVQLIEVPIEVQVIKQKQITLIEQKYIQCIVLIQVPIQVPVIQQKVVQIQKPVYIQIQIIKEVPIYVQAVREIVKLVQIPVQVEKIITLEIPLQVMIQVPIVQFVEVPIETSIEKEIIKIIQLPVDRIVQKIVEVKVPTYVEKVVEKIVEVPVYIDREIEKIVYVAEKEEEKLRGNKLQQSPYKSYSPQRMPYLIQSPQSPPHRSLHPAVPTLSHSRRSQTSQLSDQSTPTEQHQRMLLYRQNSNDQHFYSLNPTNLLLQQKQDNPLYQQQSQSIIMRFQQNEMRINEENAYLREKMMVLTESIMEKDEEIEWGKNEVKRLKERLQQEEGYQAQVMQQVAVYEQTLHKQLATRKQLQHTIQTTKLQLLSNNNLRVQLEQQSQTYKQKLQQLQNEFTRMNSQLCEKERQMQFMQGVLRERNTEVIDVNNLCALITQQLSNSKANQQQLIQHNHKLEDELIELKSIIQDLKRDNFEQHYNEIKQKQASLDYDRQLLNKQRNQLQSMYKKQIESVLEKYSLLVEENKSEIAELETVIGKLRQENQILKNKRLQENAKKQQQQSITKRALTTRQQQSIKEDSSKFTRIIDALNKENQQLKQDIQRLQQSIQKLKQSKASNSLLQSQQQIQQHTQHNPHMKSFSFSQPQQQLISNQLLPQKSSSKIKCSKIKIQEIQDIEAELENEEVVNKLVNLVREYQLEIERKQGDIKQMKELLCSYERMIENLERDKNNMYGNRVVHNDHHHPPSTPKPSTQTSIYISTLLRKLSLYQQHLNRQRGQKLRLSMRMRELQRQLEEEMMKQRGKSRVIGEDDDELLEQIVMELETEKARNEELRGEVSFYKQEVSRVRFGALQGQLPVRNYGVLGSSRGLPNTNSRTHSIHNSQTLSHIQQLFQDSSQFQYCDKQTLLQQLKIYKLQYFKVLNWNKQLKKRIAQYQRKQTQSIISSSRMHACKLHSNQGRHHERRKLHDNNSNNNILTRRISTQFPLQPLNLHQPQHQPLHRQHSSNQFIINQNHPLKMQKSYSQNNLLQVNFNTNNFSNNRLPNMYKRISQQQQQIHY